MISTNRSVLNINNLDHLSSEEISELQNYKPEHKIRFITATALFDGHDASINIIRRLLQSRGVEVIHLGHNRTAQEIATAALQEDVQGIAISSYQGGHMEFFRYVKSLLIEAGAGHIQILGGGGGVISLQEIDDLKRDKIAQVYSPENGQKLGLEGMIGHMLYMTDMRYEKWNQSREHKDLTLARALTLLENNVKSSDEIIAELKHIKTSKPCPVLGVTGTGGAGKSSLLDEILLRFIYDFPKIKIAIICVDPSKKKTGGALLGDRIRINSCSKPQIFLRSIASRRSGFEISAQTSDAIKILRSQDFDFIIVETSGIGQGDTGILNVSDTSLYVMTPEYGASTQLEKIDMLDFADVVAVNKYERRQGPDAVRDIETTIRRSRFKGVPPADNNYPIYGTIASRFNDDGTSGLYLQIYNLLANKGVQFDSKPSESRPYNRTSRSRESLIKGERESYLADISRTIRDYHTDIKEKVAATKKIDCYEQYLELEPHSQDQEAVTKKLSSLYEQLGKTLHEELKNWAETKASYDSGAFSYQVRNRNIEVDSLFTSLSQLQLPRVAVPKFESKAQLALFLLKENLPGNFPYTAGIFPFRRKGEDPKRQFAGEGGPGRTNKRFHYLSKNDDAKRLSTAFDSVTLYGSAPNERPDIYGKVGESGVSIAHLDDMKLLFDGFDLCAPQTSVSMTINGPAPIILAMFMNAAIDQQTNAFIKSNNREPNLAEQQEVFDRTLSVVRGTVQADILKEDQAQNTCIFSTEFALKMMGDIQSYFIDKKVRNYYAVSISGYHIAEAGANPISQLAFTLANGFTYVEYYLSRGLNIDDFAPNLSFFFSNGLDPEYSVIGRVARRIWSIAIKHYYKGSQRSQKLKYHIQTSGRSLHAQEMDFNDIRTTLQALLALYDNCNSLHTNAYDEALTTPTEESVRRAMAIQLIINKEFGPNKCENTNQGSYFIDQLTDLVEEAVLCEFENISRRGGVLGAMETQYQRSKIQEESMYYEHLKHSGELPIIGVNTYTKPQDQDSSDRQEVDLIRSSYEEKDDQLKRQVDFQNKNEPHRDQALHDLTQAVLENKNIFAQLMKTVRHCTLGEITDTLYQVGGQYRRSM